MAALNTAIVFKIVKELISFDDLHSRLEEIQTLRIETVRNTERLETIEARTIKESKNFKLEMGIAMDKIDHQRENMDKNALTVEKNKNEYELTTRRIDGSIENVRQKIDLGVENASQITKSTGPSFKMEEVFNHIQFKKLEEFEEFARDRFADLEYKIKHIDIHTLDTSDFVKSHQFDQSFRKIYEEFEEIKTSSMTKGEVFKK